MAPGPRPRPIPIAARLGLLALVLAPLVPLALQRVVVLQHDVVLSDLLHNQFPYRAFLGRWLREGVFPLWMPDVFSGVPFLAQIEAGALYPPNAVLFGLFEPFVALNLSILLAFAVAALGARHLARVFGAGELGAALAGLAFAWCGFQVAHVRHMSMHHAAALAPWILAALERGLARPDGRPWLAWRAWLTVALLVALQVFAGHPQATYVTLLAVVARVAWVAAARLRTTRSALAVLGCALPPAAAVALGLALAAPQLLPTLAFNATSMRGGDLGWEFASRFPYHLPDLATFVVPEATGTLASYDYEGSIEWENYGYVGLLPLLLAGFALVRRWREGRVQCLAACLLASMLLVVGPATPFYRLAWEALPGMALFRFPQRFLLLVDLALAVLAGLGATELARLAEGRIGARAVHLAGLALLVLTTLDLGFWQMRRIPLDDVEAWRGPGPVVGSIPQAERHERLYVASPFTYWQRATDVAKGFQQGFGPYRLAGELPLGNWGVLQGVRSADGYTNMVSTRCGAFWQSYNQDLLAETFQPPPFDLQRRSLTAPMQALLDRAAVRWLVSPLKLAGPRQELVHTATFVGVFRNTSALPRAYVATRWKAVDSLRGAARWMLDTGVGRPDLPAIEVDEEPAPGPSSVHAAEVVVDEPNHLLIHLPRDAQGWLVLTDTFDPGWSATVDGAPAPLSIANGYQTALRLPAGAAGVELRYWPPGLTKGLAVAVLAALALVAWALSARRARIRA